MERMYNFYITTNSTRSVLYSGVTNDLCQRMVEHFLSRGGSNSFTGRYYCYWLIYFEEFDDVLKAIRREKEVKKWGRQKKVTLINSSNPEWKFLNYQLFDRWPPPDAYHRKDL